MPIQSERTRSQSRIRKRRRLACGVRRKSGKRGKERNGNARRERKRSDVSERSWRGETEN
jgi:hypothetical protein